MQSLRIHYDYPCQNLLLGHAAPSFTLTGANCRRSSADGNQVVRFRLQEATLLGSRRLQGFTGCCQPSSACRAHATGETCPLPAFPVSRSAAYLRRRHTSLPIAEKFSTSFSTCSSFCGKFVACGKSPMSISRRRAAWGFCHGFDHRHPFAKPVHTAAKGVPLPDGFTDCRRVSPQSGEACNPVLRRGWTAQGRPLHAAGGEPLTKARC